MANPEVFVPECGGWNRKTYGFVLQTVRFFKICGKNR